MWMTTTFTNTVTVAVAAGLLALTAPPLPANGESDHQASPPQPVVKGIGKGLFEIGPVLHADDFSDLDQWSVQVQSTSADVPDARVEAKDNQLEVFVPARGATVWFKPRLSGPVAIVYQVRAPEMPDTPGIVPRDVNNFWHMRIPPGEEEPDTLFNTSRYSGDFGSYDELEGYYASTGGRDNTTTRFRRYPREIDGKPVDHIALQSRDHEEAYLLTPGKTHTVQLVAYNGNVQYIVDGKVVYEIRYGDIVTINRPGKEPAKARYTRERFPAYTDGWFAFRLTTSYHLYSDFRVFRLKPAAAS
jgi:hypothetical protein